ncbi:hypothetical protein EON66_06010 [archaeon]|nr:MAG: hypothetical protein EON66_06010 [archaeon]
MVAVKILSFPDDPMERNLIASALPEVAIMEELSLPYIQMDASTGGGASSGLGDSPRSAVGAMAHTLSWHQQAAALATERMRAHDDSGTMHQLESLDDDSAVGATHALAIDTAYGCPTVLLLDYGVTAGACWIIMERCEMSVRSWRADASPPSARLDAARVLQLLDVFACIVHRLDQLHAAGVSHYDVKCDNVLLRAGFDPVFDAHLHTLRAGGERHAVSTRWLKLLPYICFTDFGESVFHPWIPASLSKMEPGRGTECLKAPELLLAQCRPTAAAQSTTTASAPATRVAAAGAGTGDVGCEPVDNARTAGGGTPTGSGCDIWSLGCLLFELLTGSFLFQSDDWVRFFITVTGGATTGPLLAETLSLAAGAMTTRLSPKEIRTALSPLAQQLGAQRSGVLGDNMEGRGVQPAVPQKQHLLPLVSDTAAQQLRAAVGVELAPIITDGLLSILVREPEDRPTLESVREVVISMMRRVSDIAFADKLPPAH